MTTRSMFISRYIVRAALPGRSSLGLAPYLPQIFSIRKFTMSGPGYFVVLCSRYYTLKANVVLPMISFLLPPSFLSKAVSLSSQVVSISGSHSVLSFTYPDFARSNRYWSNDLSCFGSQRLQGIHRRAQRGET